MSSTFSGLNMALLGLNASQRALNVTGQNITNINTSGYTRQRLDLASITPTGAGYFNMRYNTKIGQGVMVTGVSQIRDPFLDIQFRNQLTKVGTTDAKDQVLAGIGDIFDNVDVSTVQNALDDVVGQLQALSGNGVQDMNDNLVRSSFEVLLSYIHQNAADLESVASDLKTKIDTTVIPKVNDILTRISQINESIKSSQVLGSPALELKDQRNALIDDLATYLPIEVVYGKDDVGGGIGVETLSIKLKGDYGTGGDVYLVNDIKPPATLGMETDADGKLQLKLEKYMDADGNTTHPGVDPGDPDVDNNLDDISGLLSEGILKGNLDMYNKAGMFDDPASDVKGIGYYKKMFDSFVNTLATKMNGLNDFPDKGGGKLFSPIDDTKPITASNIKISDEWMKGDVKLVSAAPTDVEGSKDNILRMKNLLSTDEITFGMWDNDGKPLDKNGTPLADADKDKMIVTFTGNMPGGYTNIQAQLGIEIKSTASILENQSTVLANSANARDSVMGVSLDEEVTSLMQYQQSYGAAARLMTAMDEILDKLINSTGVVGR